MTSRSQSRFALVAQPQTVFEHGENATIYFAGYNVKDSSRYVEIKNALIGDWVNDEKDQVNQLGLSYAETVCGILVCVDETDPSYSGVPTIQRADRIFFGDPLKPRAGELFSIKDIRDGRDGWLNLIICKPDAQAVGNRLKGGVKP